MTRDTRRELLKKWILIVLYGVSLNVAIFNICDLCDKRTGYTEHDDDVVGCHERILELIALVSKFKSVDPYGYNIMRTIRVIM